jgi:ABC-type sugar transport system permease subunit
MCWQQIGYMMIIYIAGLQNVPPELLEAAEIDGATPWQTLWKVKIPMVMPSMTICLFLTITNSFKLFDQNLALTGGEPAHATEMLALNIYNTFYGRSGPQWKGIGQAKAVVFFLFWWWSSRWHSAAAPPAPGRCSSDENYAKPRPPCIWTVVVQRHQRPVPVPPSSWCC